MLAQIEREIAQLKTAIAEQEAKVAIAYQHYINALSSALGKYLLNAVFWLCTHEYPHAFLALSTQDKQKLQRETQQLAKSCQAKVKQQLELPLIQGTLNYTEQIVHCIQYETCIISSLVRKNSDIISSVFSRSLSRPQWLPRKEERSQALWIIYLKLCGIPPSCPVMGRMQSLLS